MLAKIVQLVAPCPMCNALRQVLIVNVEAWVEEARCWDEKLLKVRRGHWRTTSRAKMLDHPHPSNMKCPSGELLKCQYSGTYFDLHSVRMVSANG